MEAVELYAATLGEMKRQAAQLGAAPEAGGDGDGSGSSSSEGSGGWVVLESDSTPARLPGTAGCSLWPQQQWRIAYEILFCQCPPEVAALRPHQDDMLFFVYTDAAAAAARARLFVRRRQARAAALPPDLQPAAAADAGDAGGGAGSKAGSKGGPAESSKAAQVDWRASVLLMVVLQTAYRLSLVTSPDADLLNAFVEDGGSPAAAAGTQGGAAAAARVHQVTQAVHPSPSRVPVNLDHSRSDAGQPKESYPDICFAVDSGDHSLQSQVLRQPGDCYCVLLHADVTSSWRMPALAPPSSSSGDGGHTAADVSDPAVAAVEQGMAALGLSQSEQRPSSGSLQGGLAASSSGSVHSSAYGSAQGGSPVQARPHSVVAFSGYVSHQQLTAALGRQLVGDPVRQVLRAAAAAARGKQRGSAGGEPEALATCRVSMRGPGGRGHADVAVSSFSPAGDAGHLPGGRPAALTSGSSSGGGQGKPLLFAKAEQLVRGVAAAAKQAAAQAAGDPRASAVDIEKLALKCALMSLQIPVDLLADAILRAL